MENLVTVKRTPDAGFWSGKKVLITGHTGFKGSWMVIWLNLMGANVHGISLAPEGDVNLFSLADLSELCGHNVADLRNAQSVADLVRKIEPEIVFHMGSQALVRRSIADPVETYSTNVLGTVNLLESLRGQKHLQAMLGITSDKVYLNTNSGKAFSESAPLGGKDPYSASKAAQEIVIQSYRQSFFESMGVPLASARGGNVIGGGDFSEDRIIPDIVRSLESGVPLVLRHPEATRPWQHVLDCLNGYLLFAQFLASGAESVVALNIGPDSDQEFATVEVLVNAMFDAFGKERNWKHQPVDGSIEAGMLALNNAKAKALLNWTDNLTGDSMISETTDWYSAYFGKSDIRAVTQQQIEKFCR